MQDVLFQTEEPKGCEHRNTKVTPTPHLTHYAREDCQDCKRFVRWLPKPETITRQLENQKKIAALEREKNLSEWEKGFILSLTKQGKNFSPKQQATLDKIISERNL